MRTAVLVELAFAALGGVSAHGDHGSDNGVTVNPGDSWQVKHMKLEHGLDNFDAYSFFTLHDNDGKKTWDRRDILNLYGLLRTKSVGDGSGTGGESVSDIDEATQEHVFKEIIKILDTDGDGVVSIDEWRRFTDNGGELPDFGLGSGHHGDYEYEYEVHHWQKFHKGVDPDVKIVHPEDVEHERLYHQYEHGDSAGDKHDSSNVWIQRIPKKFLKQ